MVFEMEELRANDDTSLVDDSIEKSTKKNKELDPSSKPFTPSTTANQENTPAPNVGSNRKGCPSNKSSPGKHNESDNSDLRSSLRGQFSPHNDSGLGSMEDHDETGSERSDASPSLSRFDSSITSWEGENVTQIGSEHKENMCSFSELNDSYFSPPSPAGGNNFNRGAARKKIQRKCSTPTNAGSRQALGGFDLHEVVEESCSNTGKLMTPPERPKSVATVTRKVEEPEPVSYDTSNWEVIGLELPHNMLNKDITSAGGGGAGSDQWGPAGGMGGCNKQDYYWFPFRQEYKLDNLEHDSKNQTLFQQLYDKVEYTDNPGNAYATIDREGNYNYVLNDHDRNTVKGKNTFLVKIYKVK